MRPFAEGSRHREPGRPRRLRASSRRALLAWALLGVAGFTPGEQEVPVPADLQYPLVAKILTFDRNLKARSGAELVVGVIHQTGYPASLSAMRELERAVAASPIRAVEGIPVRVVAVPLRNLESLEADLRRAGVNLAYVAPLRAVDVGAVAQAARAAGALTVTGVPGYVSQGISVGLGLHADRPRILINLTAARADGADFAAGLLSLADVVR